MPLSSRRGVPKPSTSGGGSGESDTPAATGTGTPSACPLTRAACAPIQPRPVHSGQVRVSSFGTSDPVLVRPLPSQTGQVWAVGSGSYSASRVIPNNSMTGPVISSGTRPTSSLWKKPYGAEGDKLSGIRFTASSSYSVVTRFV